MLIRTRRSWYLKPFRHGTALQGNELFRNQDFKEALNRNKIALDYIDDELLFQLQGRYLDDAHAVKAPLHLNSAACHLKLEDWSTAAEEASECMKLLGSDSEDLAAKALFRRAKAYAGGGRTDDAMKDLEIAKQLCAPLLAPAHQRLPYALSASTHSATCAGHGYSRTCTHSTLVIQYLFKFEHNCDLATRDYDRILYAGAQMMQRLCKRW